MSARYLIWSNQHGSWWGPNRRRGYTLRIEEAGRYELDEARRVVADSTVDGRLIVPRASHVGNGLINTVDEVLVLAPESLTELHDMALRAEKAEEPK